METNHKLLASLAVFGELCEKNKGIHEILADFIMQTIKEEKEYSFETVKMATWLKNKFEFDIPIAISRSQSPDWECIHKLTSPK